MNISSNFNQSVNLLGFSGKKQYTYEENQEAGNFNPQKLKPLDVVSVNDYGKAMNGCLKSDDTGIVLTKPDKEGKLDVLVLGDYHREVKTLSINPEREDDKIVRNFGTINRLA
ncbi:MAG TPA: hypothetical protein DDW90_10585 [Cyanobacteria bacterium UBA9971]|nr:hypothetical protein [Cyanobacteria bacterium UBA9971]